jgi:hypothetical protein
VRKLTCGNSSATVRADPHAAPSVLAPYNTGTQRPGSAASVVTTLAASGSDMPMKKVGHNVTAKMMKGRMPLGMLYAPK